MRISKVTELSHLKKTEFGYLAKDRKDDNSKNKDEIAIDINSKLDSLKFEKSMQDRIVKKTFKYNNKNEKTNEITTFIMFLCFGKLNRNKKAKNTNPKNTNDEYEEMINKLRRKFLKNNCIPQESKELIKYSLTNYSHQLKDSKGQTIEQLIYKVIEDSTIKNKFTLDNVCIKMKEKIKNEISIKKEKLAKSLINNKVQFKIENNKLVPQSKRTEWIMSFIDNDSINNAKFESLSNIYSLEKLEKLFDEQTEIKNNKQIKTLLQKHYKENWTEKKYNLSIEEKKELSFYANEVNIYFAHYFPFTGKRKEQQHPKIRPQVGVQSNEFVKAKDYYLKAETIENIVKKQILNQLSNTIITQGKLIDYYYDFVTSTWSTTDFTTKTFEEIRINEAFKKQILNTISFAFNRLKYFVNENSNNDISDSKFDAYYKVLDETKCFLRIRQFLNYKDGDIFEKEILKEIHSSTNTLRLKTYHFKKGNGLELFTKKEECPLAEKFLKNDIDLVSEQFTRRFITMNIPIYYKHDTVKKILEKCEFSFENLTTNLRPSFNKVFQKGSGLYNDDDGTDNYSKKIYDCDWYKQFENKKEHQPVYKNILQLLYTNVFIPKIAKNEIVIKKNFFELAISKNEQLAKCKGEKDNVYKYREIKSVLSDIFSDKDLTNAIIFDKMQGLIMKEEALLEDEAFQEDKLKKNVDASNKFVEYIQDVFVLAFNQFLEDNFKEYKQELFNPIKREENKITVEEKNKFKSYIKINISSFDNFEYPNFYIFARILSKMELNELKNQFTKYIAYLEKPYINGSDKNQIRSFKKIIELMEIINLTEPKNAANDFEYMEKIENDNSKDDRLYYENEALKKAYKDNYSKFIEGGYDSINNYVNLYSQTQPSNITENYETSLIPQRGLSYVSRLGTLSYYENVLANEQNYFVTKDEYKNYIDNIDVISKQHETKIEKHKELIELYKKNKNERNYTLINEKIKEYEIATKEISKYDKLKNKLTFTDLNRVNNIHMSILSRLVGFANDWEKDMLFILKYFQYCGCFSLSGHYLDRLKEENTSKSKRKDLKRKLLSILDDKYDSSIKSISPEVLVSEEQKEEINAIKELINNENKINYVDPIFYEGKCLGSIMKFLKIPEYVDFAQKIFFPLIQIDLNDFPQKGHVRNQIAHFEQLTHDVSIMDLINGMRDILAYDRKKKNSVTKAIIDLLDKENIVLSLKKENNIFEIKTIKTKQIKHLKMFESEKNINIDCYSDNFVRMIQEVMTNKTT